LLLMAAATGVAVRSASRTNFLKKVTASLTCGYRLEALLAVIIDVRIY
jgi:hypothetical protein